MMPKTTNPKTQIKKLKADLVAAKATIRKLKAQSKNQHTEFKVKFIEAIDKGREQAIKVILAKNEAMKQMLAKTEAKFEKEYAKKLSKKASKKRGSKSKKTTTKRK